MARLQWCREHIDEVQEACGLERRTVEEVKQAAKFCLEHGDFSPLPTKPILTLIRIKDPQVKQKAISHIQNALTRSTPTGGQYTKSLTEKEVKRIIEKAEIEVRNVEIDRLRAERDAEEQRTGIKTPSQDDINTMLGVAEDPAGESAPEDSSEETVPVATITRKEIDIYFSVMKRILCEEDIPKHRKRMDLMIANKTLVIKEK